MKRILLVALLLAVTIPSGVVAAPNGTASPTTTATPTPAPPDEYAADLYGDPAVRIVEWGYNNDEQRFRIVFESDRPRTIFITYTTSTDKQGVSRGTSTAKPIPAGRTTVYLTVPSGVVWLSTGVSEENNAFTELEADDGGSLVSGPYDGSDVRDAAIGGSLGVALAVLYEAVRAKASAHERGERLA